MNLKIILTDKANAYFDEIKELGMMKTDKFRDLLEFIRCNDLTIKPRTEPFLWFQSFALQFKKVHDVEPMCDYGTFITAFVRGYMMIDCEE